jgi:Nucleotidyltransferase domain
MIADWSAPAQDITFYLFGSRVRGDHRPNSDVDLHYVLPPNPTRETTLWWTYQNSVVDFASLRKALPGPIKWLEQHAPFRSQVEQGKVVHQDRNVACVWLPPKPK